MALNLGCPLEMSGKFQTYIRLIYTRLSWFSKTKVGFCPVYILHIQNDGDM